MERPILFSGPMVRAILAGRKTVTRRILAAPDWATPDDAVNALKAGHEHLGLMRDGRPVRRHSLTPYGIPGDRLWVRETWRPLRPDDAAPDGGPVIVRYDADGAKIMHDEGKIGAWTWPQAAKRGYVPGIHMPRWASRLTLSVVDVRPERLHDITEEDAVAEGVMDGRYHVLAFARLWDSINGTRAPWESNPWVWRIRFEVTP